MTRITRLRCSSSEAGLPSFRARPTGTIPIYTRCPFVWTPPAAPLLDGECINDPDHTWPGMHKAFNDGRNDGWMPMSVASVGPDNAPAAMGYYLPEDIPIHTELAQAFTLCDNYHCSVLGPTDPNRLYWMSASIDPDGLAGGPLVETPTLIPKNVYSWRTYPENLSGVGFRGRSTAIVMPAPSRRWSWTA